MSDEQEPLVDSLPEARVVEKSAFSIVWVIPIVAALVGGFLAWRAISEQGPTIHIQFETASGLEAGKTKIKYKDVQIGLVDEIELSEDLQTVLLTASLVPGAEKYLREDTRFWVVRAQISAGQVTGLGTVLSGAYIGVDPATDGKSRRDFVGLEVAPIVTSDLRGTLITLRSDRLGSLDRGSPVLFRSLTVGQVVGYELDAEGDRMTIQAFVEEPYDARIDSSTRFWNASGLNVTVAADGVTIDTPSIISMLVGGVSFETPPAPTPAEPLDEDSIFWLYPDKNSTSRRVYTVHNRYLLHFDQSVAGLEPGAPVEFHGITVGEVEDVRLDLDLDLAKIRIPVQIVLEPERFEPGVTQAGATQVIERLVARGLRAHLKTSNFITGALLVDFEIDEDAAPAEILHAGVYPELPTAGGSLQEITSSVTRIAQKLEALPFSEIGEETQQLLTQLNGTMVELRSVAKTVNQDLAPSVAETLARLDETLRSANSLIEPGSSSARELDRMLRDLSEAARSLRLLAEQLEQNPESLLRGKEQ